MDPHSNLTPFHLNTDTKDGLAKKLNDVFSLQLPILGVNINISAIIDRFIKKKGAGK